MSSKESLTDGRPLLTLVTITYMDRDGFIDTCQSIFKQQVDLGAFEHVVVDGGSNDGTLEWYHSNRPGRGSFRIYSEPDGGIYDAMNKGIKMATGRYVCFLNSGDVLHDDSVLEFVASALTDEEPMWGYGRAAVVDNQGNVVRKPVGIDPYSRRRHLLGRAAICHQAVWMRRSLLTTLNGFDESYGAAADYHLLLRASRVSLPHPWDRVVVDYLAGGISDTDVYRQLFRRHSARVGAMEYGRVLAVADWVWTVGQVPYIAARKLAKRFANTLLSARRR